MKVKNMIAKSLAIAVALGAPVSFFGFSAHAESANPQSDSLKDTVKGCFNSDEVKNTENQDDLASAIANCLSSSGRFLLKNTDEGSLTKEQVESSGGSCNE